MVPSGERKDPCSWFLLDGLAVETIGFGAQGWKQAGMAELADAGDLKDSATPKGANSHPLTPYVKH